MKEVKVFSWCQIFWSDCAVVYGSMMFSNVVGIVARARTPEMTKLFLGSAAPEPV